MPSRRATLFLAALAQGHNLSVTAHAENWPAWRKDGSGLSNETNLPQSWSGVDNVRWKTPLPGKGFSSPIVWNDRVFVTTAAPGLTQEYNLYASLIVLWLLTFTVLWFSFGASMHDSSQQVHPLEPGSTDGFPRPCPTTYICVPIHRHRLYDAACFRVVLERLPRSARSFSSACPGDTKCCVPCQKTRKESIGVPSPLRFWENLKPYAEGTAIRYCYNRVPTTCFLAGFSGAFVVLGLLQLLQARYRPPGNAASRSLGLGSKGFLPWLFFLLILGLGAAMLQVPDHHYLPRGSLASLVVVFVAASVIQLLLARGHASEMRVDSQATSRPTRLLSWLYAWFLLGLTGTFLAAVHSYFLADVPIQDTIEYTTWFATADICSIRLVAALGLTSPWSAWRPLVCGIVLFVVAVLSLGGFRYPPGTEWWSELHAGGFMHLRR